MMKRAGPERPPHWTRFSSMGFEFAAAVVVFSLIGLWVDGRWGCKPWGVLIGLGLGLVGATYNLLKESAAAFGRDRSRTLSDTGRTDKSPTRSERPGSKPSMDADEPSGERSGERTSDPEEKVD